MQSHGIFQVEQGLARPPEVVGGAWARAVAARPNPSISVSHNLNGCIFIICPP